MKTFFFYHSQTGHLFLCLSYRWPSSYLFLPSYSGIRTNVCCFSSRYVCKDALTAELPRLRLEKQIQTWGIQSWSYTLKLSVPMWAQSAKTRQTPTEFIKTSFETEFWPKMKTQALKKVICLIVTFSPLTFKNWSDKNIFTLNLLYAVMWLHQTQALIRDEKWHVSFVKIFFGLVQYTTGYHPGPVAPPTADGASVKHSDWFEMITWLESANHFA